MSKLNLLKNFLLAFLTPLFVIIGMPILKIFLFIPAKNAEKPASLTSTKKTIVKQYINIKPSKN